MQTNEKSQLCIIGTKDVNLRMTPEGGVGRYTETHVFFVRVLPRKQIYLYKKLNDPTDISQIQCHVFLFQTKKLIHVI